MANIETGVDRLLTLIKEKHKISIADAAKILNVSKTLIQEWGSFLEEEKIIDIDYLLTNTFLVEKKVTEEDYKQKKIEFKNLREMFVRKIDTFMQTIDKDTEGIDRMKNDFSHLKKDLSVEVSKVKDELKELETYESLKQDIDKQIIDQQSSYKNKIEEAHTKILNEEKQYQGIIDSLNLERENLTEESKEVNVLEVQEEKLNRKMIEISKLTKEIDKHIGDETDKIESTKKRIKELENYATGILNNLGDKKKVFQPLIDEGTKHEKRIAELQADLLEKVSEKKKKITQAANEGEEVLQKFNRFFGRKKELEALFQKIESDRSDLKVELSKLLKKAKILEITSKGEEVTKHIESLKTNMKQIDIKKNLFQDEINRLKSLIRFK
jgi:chromosome segregation ATPase